MEEEDSNQKMTPLLLIRTSPKFTHRISTLCKTAEKIGQLLEKREQDADAEHEERSPTANDDSLDEKEGRASAGQAAIADGGQRVPLSPLTELTKFAESFPLSPMTIFAQMTKELQEKIIDKVLWNLWALTHQDTDLGFYGPLRKAVFYSVDFPIE